MKAKRLIQKHVYMIDPDSDESNTSELMKSINKIAEENKELGEEDFLIKIDKEFGYQIKTLEKYNIHNELRIIKNWISFFGIIIIVNILIAIIYFIIVVILKNHH